MPREPLTQPVATRAESALMMGQVRAAVFSGIVDYYGLDEADDYDQEEASGITAAVMEYLEPEVERLQAQVLDLVPLYERCGRMCDVCGGCCRLVVEREPCSICRTTNARKHDRAAHDRASGFDT